MVAGPLPGAPHVISVVIPLGRHSPAARLCEGNSHVPRGVPGFPWSSRAEVLLDFLDFTGLSRSILICKNDVREPSEVKCHCFGANGRGRKSG